MDKKALVFSAHSLQTYVDCARRFELSYLDGLVWPAVESEPLLESEAFLRNGRIFHEMVHQDIIGLPVIVPAKPAVLGDWWARYQNHAPANIAGEKFPEKTLVGTINGQVVVATYDLIVITPDKRAIIFDWKTWRQPERVKGIDQKLQSRIYPWLLTEAAGTLIPGLSLEPEAVEMRYWFTEKPEAPHVLQYGREKYEADVAYLGALMQTVLETAPGDFDLTSNEKKCKYCPYRSFCGRGDVAGHWDEGDGLDVVNEVAALLGDLDDYESVAF